MTPAWRVRFGCPAARMHKRVTTARVNAPARRPLFVRRGTHRECALQSARRSCSESPREVEHARPDSRACAGRVTLVTALAALLAAFRAAALEPTATVIEFYNASLNHYFITAFPEEAAMLDQGVVVPGLDANRRRPGRRGPTPATTPARFRSAASTARRHRSELAFLHGRRRRVRARQAGRRHGRFEAIAFYIDVPQNGNCGAGTTPVYRSFYSRHRAVATSNHRFLVDLTMYEHMAPSSILEGVVMCSPLSSAQNAGRRRAPARAGDVRSERRARRARPGGRHARPSSTSSSPRRRAHYPALQVRSRRPAGDVLPDRSRSAVRSRLLLAVPAAERFLPATRCRRTTSCGSASRSRCRRSW